MSSFLLYFPNAITNDLTLFERCGIGSLLGDAGPSWTECHGNGPDGGSGKFAWWGDGLNPGLPRDWKPYGEGDKRFYIGIDPNDKPKPEELARTKQHEGSVVRLNDGNDWLIPIAKQLPRILGIGKPQVKAAYKPFFDAAFKALSEWIVLENGEFVGWKLDLDEGFQFAVKALAQNYRICAEVADVLELISTDEILEVVRAATEGMEAEAFMEALKKNQPPPDTQPSLDGNSA